jgi:prevent-host-death family protein
MVMKKISAAEFKARCLRIMDDVQATRETIVITKKGRPVAKLVPVEVPSEDFLGRLTGLIQISGDIETPAEPVESWEVLR